MRTWASRYLHFSAGGFRPKLDFDPEKQSSFIRLALKYGFAAVCVLLALAVSHLLAPLVDGSPFIVFVVASLLAAWFGGLGPGIAALVIGLLIADYIFVEPVHHLGPHNLAAAASMFIHLCGAGIGLAAIFSLQRARSQERQVRLMAAELEHQVERRDKALAELHLAKLEIDDHVRTLESRVTERTANLTATVRSLEGMVYHVAHDLRAPLRALSGFTELLRESLGPRSTQQEKDWMDRNVSAAQRMDRLILDLLDYGELGYVQLNMRNVDVAEVFRDALAEISSEYKPGEITIDVISPLPSVRTDRALLFRAVTEVLSNASKFTVPARPPRIRVWAESGELSVRFFIQDNGIGLDPRHHERVFRIFERLNPLDEEKGTGIGLAIVAKTLERLGGTAGVESQLGNGSTFWLELPSESGSVQAR